MQELAVLSNIGLYHPAPIVLILLLFFFLAYISTYLHKHICNAFIYCVSLWPGCKLYWGTGFVCLSQHCFSNVWHIVVTQICKWINKVCCPTTVLNQNLSLDIVIYLWFWNNVIIIWQKSLRARSGSLGGWDSDVKNNKFSMQWIYIYCGFKVLLF